MPSFDFPVPARWSWLILAMLFCVPRESPAQQAPPPPLRVAIVGLTHGHVEGFLSALPQHKDVELVGIADSDPALFAKYSKKYSLLKLSSSAAKPT